MPTEPDPSSPPSSGAGSGATLESRVADLLTAPLAAAGLDLEGVEVMRAGKRRVLRLAVDRDGGVDLDRVADVTREVSALLDESDVMGDAAYTLEVGSPGVDRPLTLPRHWRRNRGRLVKVQPTEGAPFTGRLTASDDDADGRATLEVSGRERTVAYGDVKRATVQVELKPPKGLTPTGEPDADDHRDEE